MRRKAAAALAGILVGLSYIVPAAPGSAQEKRVAMPPVLLADGSGTPFPLGRYLGNVLVLDFWSADCGSCYRDLEFIDHLQGDLAQKKLLVLAVAENAPAMDSVKRFLTRQKLTFLKPFADPGGQAAQILGVRGLPTSFVIDRRGHLVMELEGPQQWNREDYEKRIVQLLSEPFP